MWFREVSPKGAFTHNAGCMSVFQVLTGPVTQAGHLQCSCVKAKGSAFLRLRRCV